MVRFQVGICPEKFQLDQIQNGPPPAIINLNMFDICVLLNVFLKTVSKKHIRTLIRRKEDQKYEYIFI